MKIVATIFLVLLLASCQEDFLYSTDYEDPRLISRTVNVKNVTGNSQVDVILLFDTSTSMKKEHDDMLKNAQLFFNAFTSRRSLDWKAALISANEEKPPCLGFATPFDSSHPNPVAEFQHQLSTCMVQDSNLSQEKVFDPVLKHLQDHPDFLRPFAFTAVIAMTDATEQSSMTSTDFHDRIASLKGTVQPFKYYGAFGSEDFGCDDDGSPPFYYAGSKHEELVDMTQGSFFSLCGGTFGADLAAIGETIVREALLPQIHLGGTRPDVGTLRVSYRGIPLPAGGRDEGGMWYYDYSLNSVVFYSLNFAAGTNEDVDISFAESFIYEDI